MKGILLILTASLALLMAPAGVRADEPGQQRPALLSAVQESLVSMRQARAAAERAYPNARAVDVRLVNGNRPFYIVRMVEDGRRFDVRVDARTGRVM